MLVLSRRQNERIHLGDSIVITVVRVSGDKVRLGIEAPQGVRILREELELHIGSDQPRETSEGAPSHSAALAS